MPAHHRQLSDNPIKPKPGTYALVLRSYAGTRTHIGRRGQLTIEPGYYIYVGSAFGPGGVSARVSRHCREVASKRWHIDYLREFVTPTVVWFSFSPVRLEHRWAQALAGMKGMTPIQGFGCTDCRCQTHLFHAAGEPDASRVTQVLVEPVETYRFKRGTIFNKYIDNTAGEYGLTSGWASYLFS